MSASLNAFDLPAKSQIATLQRGMGPPVWLLAAALTGWGLTSAQAWCVWLGVFLAALTPAIIGLQCLWMAWSNRSAQAAWLASSTGVARIPALSFSRIFSVWLQESAVAWRVFGIWQPWAWRSQANLPPAANPDAKATSAARQRGVVYVHGFFCNRGLWRAHMARLHGRGVPAIAVNLEPAFGGIEAYAPILERAVGAMLLTTGLPPVIVAHSMGGLACRAWLLTSQADRVHRVITLGTPHHGTAIAASAHTRNGKQMRLRSPWLQALAAAEAKRPNGCEKFLCVLSDGDNIVFPTATACLPGAPMHFIPACGHVALVDHPDTYALLDRALAAPISTGAPS